MVEEGDVVDVVAGESSEDGGEVCVCVGEKSMNIQRCFIV